MSSNLAVIRELYRHFKEKDYNSFQEICDENIIWNQNPGFPNGNSHRGAQDVIDHVFMSFDETWDEWKLEISQFYDAGEAIIVTGVYEGRHKKTGKAFVSEAAHLYEIKKGKVVRFQQYADSKIIWDAMR